MSSTWERLSLGPALLEALGAASLGGFWMVQWLSRSGCVVFIKEEGWYRVLTSALEIMHFCQALFQTVILLFLPLFLFFLLLLPLLSHHCLTELPSDRKCFHVEVCDIYVLILSARDKAHICCSFFALFSFYLFSLTVSASVLSHHTSSA